MTCPVCSASMMGDGYASTLRCEFAEVPEDAEPDSGPYYCGVSDMEAQENCYEKDIIEKFIELKKATEKLNETSELSRQARKQETDAINDLNRIQKEIDDLYKKIRQESPNSSDWYKGDRSMSCDSFKK